MSLNKLLLRIAKFSELKSSLGQNLKDPTTPNITSTKKIWPIQEISASEVSRQSKKLLNFASYDFFNLNKKPAIKKALNKAEDLTNSYKLNYRPAYSTTNLHIAAETRLAQFYKTESAIIFPSRSQAFMALLASIAQEYDKVFFNAGSENPVVDLCSLLYCTPNALSTEGLFSESLSKIKLDPSEALNIFLFEPPFVFDKISNLNSLPQNNNSLFLIDETYSTGQLGFCGAGLSEVLNYPRDQIFIFAELSFSVNLPVAFIAGNKIILEHIRSLSRSLLFERSPSISTLSALPLVLDEIELMQAERISLELKKELFLTEIRNLSLLKNLIPSLLPMLIFEFKSREESLEFFEALTQQGILADSFSYSGFNKVHHQIRLCINSSHTEHDIKKLALACETFSLRK